MTRTLKLIATLMFAVLTTLMSGEQAFALGWQEHADTTLASECPERDFGGEDYNFSFHCQNVTTAWSGGAYDTSRDRLYIWGGGHGDYYGNEIYAYDVNAATLTRLTDPTTPTADRFDPNVCPPQLTPYDGSAPNGRHTYDGLAYMSHIDRMWAFSGSLSCMVGGADNVTWLFDPQTNTWLMDTPTGSIPDGNVSAVSAYDPATGLVYLHNRKALYSYEYTATGGHYTQLNNDGSPGLHGNAVIDPSRERLYIFGNGIQAVYDISANSTFERQILNGTGDLGLLPHAAPGLAYDPLTQEIVGWAGDGKIYRFNPDTGHWTSTVFGNGPGPQHHQGTYGRFAYSSTHDQFVVYNRWNLNAFTFTPARGAVDNTPPTAPASVVPESPLPSIVKLSWAPSQDNFGVVGYRVYRDGVLVADTVKTEHSELSLQAGTEYRFHVTAYDSAGLVSAPSAEAVITTALPQLTLPLGDCSAETALNGRSDIVFCEPWEDPNWWQNGYLNDPIVHDPQPALAQNLEYTQVISDQCYSGNCLRVETPRGVTRSLNLYWPLEAAEQAPEKMFLRYYLKLAPNWTPDMCNAAGEKVGAGGKFPGIADPRTWADEGGQCGNGGNASDGQNCWSMRSTFRDCYSGDGEACASKPDAVTRFGSYLNHYDMQESTADAGYWDGDDWGQTRANEGSCATNPRNMSCGSGDGGVLVPDRWYRMEMQVTLNTPGASDGIVRGWVDGVLSYEKTNTIIRISGHDMLHNRVVWLNVYKGGMLGNCEDSAIFLDQMVITTQSPPGGVDSTTPQPPSLTFSALPDSVALGEPISLQWEASDAGQCVASGAWSGERADQGLEVVQPTTDPSIFDLSCTGPGGTVTKSVTVGVLGGSPTDPGPEPGPAPGDSGPPGEDIVLAQLPFEEGAGNVAGDLSGNGNDGALANGAQFATETPNDSAFALHLDGVDDFVDLGNLDVNGSGLTLAAWFKADSFPSPYRDARLISKATGTAENDHLFMLSTIASGSATRLRARVRVGGSTTTLIADSGNLLAGNWSHAALTYDGSTLRLYLNGVEIGSTSLSGAVDRDATAPLTIGGQAGGTDLKYFDGMLDDVLIAQYALSATEIVTLATGNEPADSTPPTVSITSPVAGEIFNDNLVTVSGTVNDNVGIASVRVNGVSANVSASTYSVEVLLDPGVNALTAIATDTAGGSAFASILVAYTAPPGPGDDVALVRIPFDEGFGAMAGDASGNGHYGALMNGATFVADSADGSAFSVELDGADDYVDLGALDISGDGLTLAAWFKADSFPGSSRDPRLISKATGTADNDHVFMLSTIASDSATRLRGRLRIGGSTTTLIANSGDLIAGEWAHAALTHDGTILRLYLNGVEVGSTALAGTVDRDASAMVAIGGQPAGAGPRYFDGMLDDIFIAQRALSAAELVALASGNEADGTPPTVHIDSPSFGEVLPDNVVVVSGTVNDDVAIASVSVNGVAAAIAGDAFSATVTMNPDDDTLTAVATDSAGNSSTDSIIVQPAAAAPAQVRVSSIYHSTRYIRGELRLSARVYLLDDSEGFVENATVTATWTLPDGSTLSQSGISNIWGRATFDLRGTPGTYRIDVQDVAKPGYEFDMQNSVPGTSITYILPDSTAPFVSIDSPASGAQLDSSQVIVSGTVSDNVAVATVSVNGVAASISGNSYSAIVPLAIGLNTLTAVAVDSASTSNSASTSISVTFTPPPAPAPAPADVSPPSVSIDDPANGTSVNDAMVSVSGTVDDNVAVAAVTVNGVASSISNGSFSASVPLSPGTNVLTAVGIDAAGNSNSDSITITYTPQDLTPPSVSIDSPTFGADLASDEVTVSGTVSDDIGLASVSVNGVPANIDGASYSASVMLATGANTLTAIAIDDAGNEASDSIEVSFTPIVDATPPSVTIDDPGEAALLSSSEVIVSGTVGDDVAIAAVSVNGVSAVIDGGSYSASVSLNSGTNTLTAIAIDTAGNSAASNSVTVIYTPPDLTPPSVNIDSPSHGASLSGEAVTVSGTVHDNVAIASVTVNDVVASLEGNTFSASVPLSAGANTVNVIAIDEAGNGASDSVEVMNVPADETLPTLSIDSPADGTNITNAVVNVTGTVNDNVAVESVTVNGVSASISANSFSASVTLSPGANTLTASAIDAAGNSASTSITVDHTPVATVPQIRVSSIYHSARYGRGELRLRVRVYLRDEQDKLVEDAQVSVTWTLPDGSTQVRTATSNDWGRAIFGFKGPGGTYHFAIDGVDKAGYSLDTDGSILSKTMAH